MDHNEGSGRRLVASTDDENISSSKSTCSSDVLSSTIVDLICKYFQERTKNATSDEIIELQSAVSELQEKIGALGQSLSSRAKATVPSAPLESDSSSCQPVIATRVDEKVTSSADQLSALNDEGNDKASISEVEPEGPLHNRRVSRLSQPCLPPSNALNNRSSTARRQALVIPAPSEGWKRVATEAFNVIDDNGDGFLQKEEVIAAVKMMEENGMSFSASGDSPTEIAENMMKEVDIDGDGLIDFDEFIEMMRKNNLAGKSGHGNGEYHHRMSQLANSVLLAHQKKQENSAIGMDMWMIHPLSTFHVSWDIMVSLLIIITVITMPLSIGWEEINDSLFALNLTVDMIFLFDVVKNFCTGVIDENDAVIMDYRTVRRKYIMGYFLPDICSSIPLDLIFRLSGMDERNAVTGTKHSLKMLKLLRMAKLFRLLRLSRLANHLKELSIWVEETLNIRISDGFTKLIRLGIGAVVLGHWIGCFNFMLVRMHDFPEDSWVVYAGLDNKDAYTQWSWSFFKALAQMIMIGFETPPFTNASCDTASHWCGIEHWVTLCCLYIGAVFYSLLISSISSILQSANLATRQFEEKLTQIDDYMRSKKLPSTLREKVKDCFHLQHSNGKLYVEDEILEVLSPILRREIKLFTGRDLTVKVPLLSSVRNKNFAEEMVAVIEPMMSFEDEVIIREDTIGDEMYFINSGVVEIFLTGVRNIEYVAIGDGCYFGEVSLLLNTRRTASAKTKTQCTLFKIAKDKLINVLRDFPDTLEHMTKVAESRQRRLKHFIDPSCHLLLTHDKIDSEDCKTELFGADADKIVVAKEEETIRSKMKRQSSTRLSTAIQRSPQLSTFSKGSLFSRRVHVAPAGTNFATEKR